MDPIVWKEVADTLPKSTLELLLNPAAGAIGHTIAGLYYAVFGKLVQYGVVKEAETKSLIKEIAEKYNKVPVVNRTDINKGLIYKAFQDSRFSLSSDELRHLFANLIVQTTKDSNVEQASPYFSTILSNFTVEEASFLEKFKTKYEQTPGVTITGSGYYVTDMLPIYKLTLRGKGGAVADTISEATFTDANKDKIRSYTKPINVLSAFKLVEVKYGIGSESDRPNYEILKQLSQYEEYQNCFDGKESKIHMLTSTFDSVEFVPGSVQLTKLGRSFTNMVLL